MGASASLLIATIVREPFMPTRCWIAPEMPSATYSLGATVCPELPIRRSIRSPPLAELGARPSQFGVERRGETLRDGQVLLCLDAPANRNNSLRLAQVHRL